MSSRTRISRPPWAWRRRSTTTLVDTAAFTDVDGLDGTIIQKFLHKTAYDRPSFLETYQSNGVRASDAIARAARTYRINPLVFLVEAEASQGLLGEANYPFPPERVDTCSAAAACKQQLHSGARRLQSSGRLPRSVVAGCARCDRANEATTSGWGKDKTSTTLDSLKVTPTTEATAAVYDYMPRVAEGAAGGAWLFWNVWNVYAAAIDYAGPIGGPGAAGSIGDGCASAAGCGFEKSTCATNYPAGSAPWHAPATALRSPTSRSRTAPTSRRTAASASRSAILARRPAVKATCARASKRFGAADMGDSQYVCTLP